MLDELQDTQKKESEGQKVNKQILMKIIWSTLGWISKLFREKEEYNNKWNDVIMCLMWLCDYVIMWFN